MGDDNDDGSSVWFQDLATKPLWPRHRPSVFLAERFSPPDVLSPVFERGGMDTGLP